MLISFCSSTATKVSVVLETTLGAEFGITIAMDLDHVLSGYSTLSVEAVKVLTDDIL